MSETWCRVFGRKPEEVQPAHVLDGLPAEGHFKADEHGWFHGELTFPGGPTLGIDCFRVFEEGVRHEMQTWAAFVETLDGPYAQEFMEAINATAQVFAFVSPGDAFRDAVHRLCQNLAVAADGVYHIDGEGFFWSNGSLALSDGEAT